MECIKCANRDVSDENEFPYSVCRICIKNPNHKKDSLILSDFYELDNKDYKRGFEILYEYFDSIPDEQKSYVSRQLNEIGL